MTYPNPVQAAIDLVLDLDVPDEQLADALAAQLADALAAQLDYFVGDELEIVFQ